MDEGKAEGGRGQERGRQAGSSGEAAGEAREALEEVRATLNHDLRTPLTVIISYAQTLAQGKAGELNPVQREMLEVMVSEGYRMDGLIRETVALLRKAMGEGGGG